MGPFVSSLSLIIVCALAIGRLVTSQHDQHGSLHRSGPNYNTGSRRGANANDYSDHEDGPASVSEPSTEPTTTTPKTKVPAQVTTTNKPSTTVPLTKRTIVANNYSKASTEEVATNVSEQMEDEATKQHVFCGKQMLNQLIANQPDKNIQPRVPTVVNLRVIVMSINEVADENSVVGLTARFEFKWRDQRLRLPMTNNDNISLCANETLVTKLDSMWFPYFEIQNGAKDVIFPDSWEKYPAILHANGLVEWRVSMHIELTCMFDVTYFPFDSQLCNLLVVSPLFDMSELTYTVPDPKAAIIRYSPETSHPMWLMTQQFINFPTRSPGIQFWYRLDRRPFYYVWVLVIPSIATALQTGSTFILPADGEEKISTAVSGLLGYFFLFQLFTDQVPHTSDTTPMVMVFFAYNILLTALATLAACLVQGLVKIEEEELEDCFDSVTVAPSVRHNKKLRLAMRRRHSTKQDVERAKQQSKKQNLPWYRKVKAKDVNEICLVAFFAMTLIGFLTFGLFVTYKKNRQDEMSKYNAVASYINNAETS